ncbi:hypothetical protein DTO212C5_4272 [Paecilomyces variotii]|nr:hypothetical protein DTO212C5_4272 [Paecilomyces variotii]
MADLRQATTNQLTTKSRQRRWKLERNQLSYWVDFATQARKFSQSPYILQQIPPPDYTPLPKQPQEILIVANKSGIIGRFLNNLAVKVAQIYHRLSLPIFADSQTGRNYPKGYVQGEIPNFILLGQNRTTTLIGEIKTPWTTDLDNIDNNNFKSIWGQIARYMDDCHCRYSVVPGNHGLDEGSTQRSSGRQCEGSHVIHGIPRWEPFWGRFLPRQDRGPAVPGPACRAVQFEVLDAANGIYNVQRHPTGKACHGSTDEGQAPMLWPEAAVISPAAR